MRSSATLVQDTSSTIRAWAMASKPLSITLRTQLVSSPTSASIHPHYRRRQLCRLALPAGLARRPYLGGNRHFPAGRQRQDRRALECVSNRAGGDRRTTTPVQKIARVGALARWARWQRDAFIMLLLPQPRPGQARRRSRAETALAREVFIGVGAVAPRVGKPDPDDIPRVVAAPCGALGRRGRAKGLGSDRGLREAQGQPRPTRRVACQPNN